MTSIVNEQLATTRKRNQKRMLYVLAITVSFMLVELIAAWLTHSLALLADAGHMLTDVGAMSLGLIAFWFASKPATPGKTYGYYRSEILAGFVNALLLVSVSFFIIHEAWQRLKVPTEISPLPVFCVALLALFVNLGCLKFLNADVEGKEKKSINMSAAALEIYVDALVSAGVVISSVIIFFTHWYAADALVSMGIGLFILPRTWILLSECINILMEGTPQHIDLGLLKESMLSVPGVTDVHDIHVWTITSGLDSMSAHVTINQQTHLDQALEGVTKVLQEKFNLSHTTIQIEQAACQTEANICS
jgi:cobalt-zinc-cadmium efflux system protein